MHYFPNPCVSLRIICRKVEGKFKGSFPILSVIFLCKQELPLGCLQRITKPHDKSNYFNQDSDYSIRKGFQCSVRSVFPKQGIALHLNQSQFCYTE